MADLCHDGNVHYCWEARNIRENRVPTRYNFNSRIITALTSVDVIVGMYRGFRTELPAEYFDSPVRDHLEEIMTMDFEVKKEGMNLVGVHVTLRSAASLEDDQWEMIC